MLYCVCETASFVIGQICLFAECPSFIYRVSANGTLKSKTHAKTADALSVSPFYSILIILANSIHFKHHNKQNKYNYSKLRGFTQCVSLRLYGKPTLFTPSFYCKTEMNITRGTSFPLDTMHLLQIRFCF